MTAFKAALSGNGDFANTTVPARILDNAVSDTDAYRISFTENLGRKDLSVWEIAKTCLDIEKQMKAAGIGKTEIDDHIASLLQKHPRTVRRYLKLAAIKNDDLADAVHNGSINYLDALEIGENHLEVDDITALLGHLKTHPKPTRAFKQFYDNLEFCCDKSKMSLAAVLECKNADEFLSFEEKKLEKRIEHLRGKTGKGYPDILKGKAGSLNKDASEIDAGLERKKAGKAFQDKNKDIVDRVQKAFSRSDVDGTFKILPAPAASGDNRVSVTITVPESQMWQAFDAASKAKNKHVAKVIRRFQPKAPAAKLVTSESGNPTN